MAMYHGTTAGVGTRAGKSSGRVTRSAGSASDALRPIRLVGDDADEALREGIRRLREKYRRTIGCRGLLFIREALRPERRPQTVIIELQRIFARGGATRDELRLVFGAWLERELVMATPEPVFEPLRVLRCVAIRETHQAVQAIDRLADEDSPSARHEAEKECREGISALDRWLGGFLGSSGHREHVAAR